MAAELSSLLVKIGADLSDLGNGLNKGEGMLSKFGKVSAAAAAAAGVALAGIGVAAVKLAADFEQGLSNVKAVSGATTEEMKGLHDLALKLGADTKFSAGEAVQGMEELIKAGLTPAQVEAGALKGALDLAAAGELELGESAEIAATAINTFKLNASDMTMVANTMAGAANASATDVGELKMALSQAGLVASQVGVSFQDTVTTLGVFAQNGLKGSDAGTSLKTMLMRLNPTTDEAAGLMSELGLVTAEGKNQFFDAAGNMKSMSDIAGILQDATTGLTAEQKQMYLGQIFGADAIRGVNALLSAGTDGYNQMSEAMGKVSAADVAAEKMNNLKGIMENLSGSVETILIVLGEKFLPVLRDMAAWLAEKMPTIQAVLEKTFDAIGKAINWVSENVLPLFKGAFSDSSGQAAAAMQLFQEKVVPVLEKVWGVIQKFVEAVKLIWAEWGDEIMAVARVLFDTVWTVISTALDVIGGLLDVFIGLFTGDWTRMKDGLIAIWNGLWKTIDTILGGLWDILGITFGGLWDSIKSWFTELATDAYDWGVDLMQGFLDGIKGMFKRIRDAVVGFVNDMVDKVKGVLDINSPSKVFADIGANIGKGLALGIEGTEVNVNRAMQMVLPNVTSATRGGGTTTMTPSTPQQVVVPVYLFPNGPKMGETVREWAFGDLRQTKRALG